ncbi:SGNH hydrolase-type esterase domain containing protein [Trema orientale]|uniref:SGNH hydrolase-type esterase domain containing protein n=1 Tax=Trema orientale TaxID=63057 RepID=A0A2P5DD53_TREOI|nr:SGNH hydrolase-type esterase domain containing protein [Trema orientale]
MFIFGDSHVVVDVGNNSFLTTLVKSNFPPYGRDFFLWTTQYSWQILLAIDYLAGTLNIDSYQFAISLQKQLDNYKEYQGKVVEMGIVREGATGLLHTLLSMTIRVSQTLTEMFVADPNNEFYPSGQEGVTPAPRILQGQRIHRCMVPYTLHRAVDIFR